MPAWLGLAAAETHRVLRKPQLPRIGADLSETTNNVVTKRHKLVATAPLRLDSRSSYANQIARGFVTLARTHTGVNSHDVSFGQASNVITVGLDPSYM